MTCIKCKSKIGNKPKAIELNLCNKCYKKKDSCCVDGCNKKIFMSEHCSSHIHLVREVKKPVAFKEITEEDRERRLLRSDQKAKIQLEFERRQEEINEYKNSLDYDPFTSSVKKNIIRGLEQELESARTDELYRVERKLEDLKDYYRSLPQVRRNKFKCYMEEEPDHHKKRKKAKQSAKEQRSRARGHNSEEIPNDSNTESQFDILVREAFTLLDTIKTNEISLIKRAYYKQAIKWHPDKNTDQDTTEIFQEIGSAYEFLCDNIDDIDM